MAQNDGQADKLGLFAAPRGLAILAVVGPSMVWAAKYIGSGEVSPRDTSLFFSDLGITALLELVHPR
jgi:hypothetical protein